VKRYRVVTAMEVTAKDEDEAYRLVFEAVGQANERASKDGWRMVIGPRPATLWEIPDA